MLRSRGVGPRQGAERVTAWISLLLPTLGAIVAVALWLGGHAPGAANLIVFAVGAVATLFGIEGGYHRLLTHRSYAATDRTRAALGILGSTSFQGPVIFWVANHRRHHQFADKDGDPHSPHSHGGGLRGLVHAHGGWMLGEAAKPEVWIHHGKDLFRDPQLLWVHLRYHRWLLLGLAVPALLGGLLTLSASGAMMGLLWGGLVRAFVVNQITYATNSIGHRFGSRHESSRDQSVNNWLLVFLALGGGWHNNHHRYPGRAIMTLRWWQIDPIGWMIYALKVLGLVGKINDGTRGPQRRAPIAWRHWLSPAIALLAIVGSYVLAQEPSAGAADVSKLRARFAFSPETVRFPDAGPAKAARAMNPHFERVAAFVSGYGSAAAFADFDNDGIENDLCLVDARYEAVMVAPVSGTGDRFPTRVLKPAPAITIPDHVVPSGCVPSDLNEDGDLDLLVLYLGRPPLAYLGDGTGQTWTPVEIGLDPAADWYTAAATTADIDGDGHLDIVIGNYVADGSEAYKPDSSANAELPDSMSAAYNGGTNRVLLWAGVHAGAPRFRDAGLTHSPEVANGWTLAVSAADLDGDGLPELYIANDFGPDRLLHNESTPGEVRFTLAEGQRTLHTPRSLTMGRDSFKSMGADFGDIDGDGGLDIFVSNITSSFGIFESSFAWMSVGSAAEHASQLAAGQAPFVDRSQPLGLSRGGWTWDARLEDFDNDGGLEAVQASGFLRGDTNRWPEIHEMVGMNDELMHDSRAWPDLRVGADVDGYQHNPFFVRIGERYHDVAKQVGLADPHMSRGIATADVDADGDLDLLFANHYEPSVLYRNTCHDCGNAVFLRLRQPVDPVSSGQTVGEPRIVPTGQAAVPTLDAVGARAQVELPDGRRLTRLLDGGNGHSGVRGRFVHFGLGDDRGAVDVSLSWRDPTGAFRHATVSVGPGRHDVLLPWQSNRGEPR